MSFTEQQKNWNRLAEVDPMWAVLSEPEKIGGKWDEQEFYETGETEAREVIEELIGLGFLVSGKMLEVGCGAGRVCHGFASHLFSEVVGYDISPKMIEIAKERSRVVESFVLNETDDLSPFDEEAFDFVYCNRVLQHIDPDRIGTYVGEMARVLKPGGVLWLQMLSHPTGNEPTRESSPLPSFDAHYTVCSVDIVSMVKSFMELGLVLHQARVVDGGEGQSIYSYEYVLSKP